MRLPVLNPEYKKAVVIDLPVDIKEVLVADPATVTVLVRTMPTGLHHGGSSR